MTALKLGTNIGIVNLNILILFVGEFEAYLAHEKLAQTKDTNARIQLMTGLNIGIVILNI